MVLRAVVACVECRVQSSAAWSERTLHFRLPQVRGNPGKPAIAGLKPVRAAGRDGDIALAFA